MATNKNVSIRYSALDKGEEELVSFNLSDNVSRCQIFHNIRFILNTRVDFEYYFDNIAGVTITKDEVVKDHVVLKFSKQRFSYVTSKPIHSSQQTIGEEVCTIRTVG